MKTCLAFLASLCLSPFALAEYQLNFQEPASHIAREQHSLHVLVLWIIVFIAIIVFGAMFYSIIMHRKSRGYKAAHFHENTVVEIIWTTVPMVIIIIMAIPATTTFLEVRDTSAPDISIKATGYQWRWHYDYLDQNIQFLSSLSTDPKQIGGLFYSSFDADAEPLPKSDTYLIEVDNEMVVPVGKKVRLLLTAADVIHAWWVPQLGVKQDAIPGFVRETWFRADKPGVFRGQCAELCGKNHGYMPIVVRAVPEEEFDAWVRKQGGKTAGEETGNDVPLLASAVTGEVAQAVESDASAPPEDLTMEDLMALGKTAYGQHCVACHQPNGQGLQPAFPSLVGAPTITGPKEGHIDIVLNGKQGTSMASFAYLSDVDIAAILTYERNSWGNQAEMVSPQEVAEKR